MVLVVSINVCIRCCKRITMSFILHNAWNKIIIIRYMHIYMVLSMNIYDKVHKEMSTIRLKLMLLMIIKHPWFHLFSLS